MNGGARPARPESVAPLSAEDARVLALESGVIRGHTVKVLVVDDAPPEDPVGQLIAWMEPRLSGVRRWRQRLVEAPSTPTGLGWQDDPDLDLGRHVRAVALDRPADEDGLRRLVADAMATPLDRGHPLWSLDVVPRLENGRWALVWKVHHALADGVAIIQAGSRLLWTEEPAQPGRLPPPRPAVPPGSAQLTAGMRLARFAGYRGLLLREFRRVGRLSPLAQDVGPDRAVAFSHCTLAEMRSIAKAVAAGATVNDVLLCVVAGALRGWLGSRELPGTPMKVQVPVSMHPHLAAGDDPCGNRDSLLLVDMPVGVEDPVARLRAVARATQLRKNRHDARAIYALRQSLAHAPDPVRRGLQRLVQGPHEYSLNVSNVPGPAAPVQVLGRRVDALCTVAEVAPHHALRVAAISLDGSLCVGLCADPVVVPDLEQIATGIRSSIDELHRRLGPRSRPSA